MSPFPGRVNLTAMDEKQDLPITPLPSLFEIGERMNPSRRSASSGQEDIDTEKLFYTCPQCGHPMVTKKCKIVCYTCHYFIGCVE
ncbi:MAG TPA: hypothetical protein VMV05_04780 [bacterium]|nr:hypothetical protein [bacterium]